jgi:hypothetical protein
MTLVILAGVAAVLLVLWVLLLLLQPVFMLIDCVFSGLPLSKKIFWVVFFFLSLGLAATVYPYLVSESRFLRIVTLLSYAPFIIILIATIIVIALHPEVLHAAFGYIEQMRELIRS